jgi:hypothetical protein
MQDERMIVDATVGSSEETDDAQLSEARVVALDWLCMQDCTEIEMLVCFALLSCSHLHTQTKSCSSYSEITAVLDTLPLPIAEEIVPHLIVL